MARTDASVPALSRQHAAGAGTARGLLFTVLGELVLPTGGSAWTSAFIDGFARFGVEEKATRQALMRTAADGWLRAERVGRRTLWRLTPAGERLLRDGTARIFGFSPVAREWDGRWTLVLARVPETDRGARHLLRSRLRWAGFGNPLPGVWLSPRSDRGEEVSHILREAGLADGQLFLAEHDGGGSLATMVDQAWDIEVLGAAYGDFIDTFSGPAGDDELARAIELVHAWRRFPSIDPGLPAQFLPRPWRGTQAAKLFARLHAKWSAAAVAAWLATTKSTP